MTTVTKEAFLKAMTNSSVKMVSIAEPFNCKVGIRLMSVRDREELEMLSLQMRGDDGKIDLRGGRAQILRRCLCDEVGHLLFSGEAEDLLFLEQLPAKEAEKLLEVAKEFNGLEDDPELRKKAAQAMKEEAEKK